MDTEQSTPSRGSGWLLGLLALTLAATIGFGLVYINNTAERFVQQSEQRDCDTLRADIEAIEQAGQLTKAGQNVTLSRRARYAQIGCTPSLPPPTYRIITPTPTR